jgi:hypothetical protein
MTAIFRHLIVFYCLWSRLPTIVNGAENVPASIIQAGAVWRDETRVLTILERNGAQFRGRFEIADKIVREFTGEVKDNEISWLAKNVRAIRGKPGHDNFGKIKGDAIEISYSLNGVSGGPPYMLAKVSGPSSTGGSSATTGSAGINPPLLTTIQSDANQPRIEVIKDQGPNATEWALTPLDEAIPADIRQNLTFLREDLLDEGKKAAKSSPDAYKLASDYCDKILTALDQRDLARVNAGYAAAQADANKATSTQALDARRNHQMSWPQFSREESQRAALRQNEADKADVKKQRLKVEWTNRSLQMRSYLDDLYRQLREAMR